MDDMKAEIIMKELYIHTVERHIDTSTWCGSVV